MDVHLPKHAFQEFHWLIMVDSGIGLVWGSATRLLKRLTLRVFGLRLEPLEITKNMLKTPKVILAPLQVSAKMQPNAGNINTTERSQSSNSVRFGATVSPLSGFDP